MKKNLLVILALVVAFGANAQKVIKKSPQANVAVKQLPKKTGDEQFNYTGKAKEYELPTSKDFTPAIIGSTIYDLQTNSSVTRRIVPHGDGTISAAWTRGMEAPSYPDRGSGFNYFDGSAWGAAPEARIEEHRTGWPAIVGIGNDVVFTHGTVDFLNMVHNSAYGASDWTMGEVTSASSIPETIWPKAVSAGSDGQTIHVVAGPNAVDFNGIVGGIGYFRSQDGGATWDIDAHELLSSDEYATVQGETWAIDAVGETVAVLMTTCWGDVAMYKSTDNGDSWTKTVILDFPDEAEPLDPNTETLDMDNDGNPDTLVTADNAGSIVIDNNGMVHCAFGLMRWDANAGTFYFPYSDGLTYWNEDMGPGVFSMDQVIDGHVYLNMQLGEDLDTLVMCPDINGDDTIHQFAWDNSVDGAYGKYGVSLTSFPNLVVGETTNSITLVYSTVMETDAYAKMTANPGSQNFRHIWAMVRDGETGEWGDPIHLTEGADYMQYEHVFPMCYRSSSYNSTDKTQKIKFIYQFDDEPGYSISDDEDPTTTNYIFYAEVEVPDDAGSVSEINNNLVNLQMNPNPANNTVTINTEEGAEIGIYTIVGAEVLKIKNANETQSIDVSNFAEGTYIVKVKTDNGIASEKLVVR